MKTRIPLSQAAIIVQDLMIKLSPYCHRLEPAGSYRRGKSEIGDIELVAMPKYEDWDLFGKLTDDHMLDLLDWTAYGKLIKGGHKYKQIELFEGVNLDLFIVTEPAQFGVVHLIRTGPAEYSHKMVTARSAGGLMPSNYRFKDGAIWSRNHIIETPEERDVFDLFGMPFVEPELRAIQ
jgi:DNA polymerase/3'-5' exonuclease PolX